MGQQHARDAPQVYWMPDCMPTKLCKVGIVGEKHGDTTNKNRKGRCAGLVFYVIYTYTRKSRCVFSLGTKFWECLCFGSIYTYIYIHIYIYIYIYIHTFQCILSKARPTNIRKTEKMPSTTLHTLCSTAENGLNIGCKYALRMCNHYSNQQKMVECFQLSELFHVGS